MTNKLSLSIMCADQLNLKGALEDAARIQANFIHADIMDGNFVQNITLGFDQLRMLAESSSVPVDAHLMVSNLDMAIPLVLGTSCSHVCFHIEATHTPIRYLRQIRQGGKKSGIAINPYASVDFLHHIHQYIDYVLVMTVEPGFAGQKFLEPTALKIKQIRELIGPDKDIMVDGNISMDSAQLCRQYGANVFVLGTSVAYSKQQINEEQVQKFREKLDVPVQS